MGIDPWSTNTWLLRYLVKQLGWYSKWMSCRVNYNGGQKNLGLCEKALLSNSSVEFCS